MPPATAPGAAAPTTEAETSNTVGEPINVRSNKPWIIAGIVALAVVAGVVTLLVSRLNDPSRIEEAAESCGVERNVGDDGSSITFDTEGDEDFAGDSIADVACVLAFVETPDRVVSQIEQTRALDGTLKASWNDYEAFWNYHPDNGMNLTVYVP